jgi:hypothetical protein
VTYKSRNAWKLIAIILAILLASVFIAAVIVITGVMDLGFSLM